MTRNIKLTKLEMSEWIGERLHWRIEGVLFRDLVLILGDNAQGKTRLFNFLSFLHRIHSGGKGTQNPQNRGESRMCFTDETDRIMYAVEWRGSSSGPTYNEKITRNDELIFDRTAGLLINEISKERVSKFFLPDTSPVVSSVKEDEYPTIRSLQSFFERMLFLHANRFAGTNIEVDKLSDVVSPTGSNIGSVLSNWRDKHPAAYREVLGQFKRSFPFINEVSTTELELRNGVRAQLLSLQEHESGEIIDQRNWSDGLLRSMCLFALPCTRFQTGDEEVRASLICIDEIENGLDFRTLAKVLNHYDSYSDLVQVAITSHSPLVCNLVEPSRWMIMKRKGPVVHALVPDQIENLDMIRQRLKTDNWDFYRRHISQSDKYSLRDE